MNKMWLTLSETVLIELEQSADEGRDVRPFVDEAQQIFDYFKAGYSREDDARILIDRIRNAPIKKDYPYIEPASLNDIKAARPGNKNTNSP